MREFERAVEEFLALPSMQQEAILQRCAEEAARQVEEFEKKIRVEPWMMDVRITI